MSNLPLVNKVLADGMAHHRAGRIEAAYTAFAKARALNATSWEAHHYGGLTAQQLGKHLESCQLFAKAFQLNPRSLDSTLSLALALLTNGQNDLSEQTLRHGLRFAPQNADLLGTLALVLEGKGDFSQALEWHQKAVTAQPRNALAWYGFGTTLMNLGAVLEAIDKFDHALLCAPGTPVMRAARAACLFRSHRVEAAVKEYRQLLQRSPENLSLRSRLLMALNSSPSLSPGELFREHQLYGKYAGPAKRSIPARRLAPEAPLRVALLSPDFRGHAVACFLLPLVRQAAANRVELHLFHDHGNEDAVSQQFKANASSWTRIAGSLDDVVESQLLNLAPDVLLDLTGHTGSPRLPLLAHRVAPLQATYLGYPNTSGVSAVDLRLVDGHSDPLAEKNAFCTERLERFSDCAWCFDPLIETPPPRETPEPTDTIVFGCFNNFTKVTDEILRQWGLLLASLPGSRLLLKSPYLDNSQVAAELGRRMADAGLNPECVDLLGHTPDTRSHLELYRKIHVALDTSPYNGTTTTCEALWMGVPVVTLQGDRHAARVGTSLLSAVGRQAWICRDWEEYRSLARNLALGSSGTEQSGAALRLAMQNSLLMDAPTQAQRFWGSLRARHQERALS